MGDLVPVPLVRFLVRGPVVDSSERPQVNQIRYSALATTFLLGTFSIMITGFGLHSPGLMSIALVPCFVGGWCAAKASFE